MGSKMREKIPMQLLHMSFRCNPSTCHSEPRSLGRGAFVIASDTRGARQSKSMIATASPRDDCCKVSSIDSTYEKNRSHLLTMTKRHVSRLNETPRNDCCEDFKGFTLIEMIISIVVLGILGIFTFAFFGNYMSTYTQMRDRRNMHQEAVYIIERISRELRDATTVTSPAAGTSTTLSFVIPTSALATGGDTSTTISYSLSGTQLNRTGNISGSILMGDSMDAVNGFAVTAITTPTPVTNCYRITVQRGTETYQTAVCPKNIPKPSSGFGGNYADIF